MRTEVEVSLVVPAVAGEAIPILLTDPTVEAYRGVVRTLVSQQLTVSSSVATPREHEIYWVNSHYTNEVLLLAGLIFFKFQVSLIYTQVLTLIF